MPNICIQDDPLPTYSLAPRPLSWDELACSPTLRPCFCLRLWFDDNKIWNLYIGYCIIINGANVRSLGFLMTIQLLNRSIGNLLSYETNQWTFYGDMGFLVFIQHESFVLNLICRRGLSSDVICKRALRKRKLKSLMWYRVKVMISGAVSCAALSATDNRASCSSWMPPPPKLGPTRNPPLAYYHVS